MRNAIRVEVLKLSRSRVGLVATLAIFLGATGLLAGITAGVTGGNPEVIAKAGPAAALNWDGLLAGAAQVVAVAAILGPGIVLAWIFAREFTDGTITGLFALPVSRPAIALAKLAAYATWAVTVSTGLVGSVLALGVVLGYGLPDRDVWISLARLAALVMLSAGIVTPIAWVATTTRSLLAAVGATLAAVVAAQVGALAGAGGWMPVAAPAIWALSDSSAVTWPQLSLSVALSGCGVIATCAAWSHLQLDR